MIVLSDGKPSASGHGDFHGHLKAVTKQIDASGVDLVGIGITDDSVRHYYKKCIVIHSVDELPGVVMGQLKSLLLK
jgi:cobaltochelatase CobT